MDQPTAASQSGALGRLHSPRRTGGEPFHRHGAEAGFDVLDFWRWSASDLLVNTARGMLAEYIVARALGISTNAVRDAWAAHDLTTAEGTKVEVKSCSYLQSWHQKAPSVISFSVKKSTAWSADTNEFVGDRRRQADVYVFALLAHQDKATVDPLDLGQWEFYVLASRTLDERTRSQHSITLTSLQGLSAGPHSYEELAAAVVRAAAPARDT